MPNHFHLVLTGQVEGGVSRLLQHVTAQYAQYLHGRLNRRGRLWQSRFYSCVLDSHHFFTALAYVDLNPVRARLADRAADYAWSSAAAHCGLAASVPEWLDSHALHARFTPDAWRERLAMPQPRADVAALRRATRAESAFGEPGFVEELEAKFQVRLCSLPPGAPPKKPIQSQHAPPSIARSAGQPV
jgi:putative transposase